MADSRHVKLAKVLVHYALALKPGDKFLISTTPAAESLLREVVREAARAGVFITSRIALPGIQEIVLRESAEEMLTQVQEIEKYEIGYFDAYLAIQASANTKAMSGIDPKRLAKVGAARAEIQQTFMSRSASGALRWCGTLFPTQAHAQDAGMSLADYEDFVFGAGMLHLDDPVEHWRGVDREQSRIIEYLRQRDTIRIVAPDTDITYRVKGRTWLNAFGRVNFPDGEVFTAPLEDSVNGKVCFSYPAVYQGNEVEDVRLTFEKGRVVDFEAKRGYDFLKSMLEMDAGAKSLGEVAFGLNYGIQKFTRNILFDEKIGGTMHMALGLAYPESGGVNQSAMHWDMVCDLREGEVFADGELCYQKGKFII